MMLTMMMMRIRMMMTASPFLGLSCSKNHFSGVVGMSYGFFLSTICDTTADAMKMAVTSFFPVLMVVSRYFPLFWLD